MSREKDKSEAVALDLQVRKVINPVTHNEEVIPELDPRWKHNIQFIPYSPLPLHIPPGSQHPVITDEASLEEWRERSSFIDEDLKWLLCLPHNEFWCQVIFDDTLQFCLDSYLQHAPRTFDIWSCIPPEVLELLQSLHKRVFMVFLRMSTHKESKTCFLTADTFGDILYNNFLFDISKIMDMCALYGGENSENLPLLKKMIDNIFSKQPKYYDDLDSTVPTLFETLDNLLTKCGLGENLSYSPQKLDERSLTETKELSQQDLKDVVSYLSDIGHTLAAFISTFPNACQSFHRQGIVSRVASFFEILMPYVRVFLSSSDMKQVRQQLRHTKTQLVKVCHMTLRSCCIEPILTSNSTKKSLDELHAHVEDYLQVLMAVLSEKRFISLYDALYSLEDDLITIQTCPATCLDETRIQYILQAVSSAHEAYPNRTKRKDENDAVRLAIEETCNGPVLEVNGLVNGPSGDGKEMEEQADKLGASREREAASCHRANDVDGVELDSMVTSVRDLLPELGEGFVIKCLEEFNYNIEKLVNSLLEGTLPTSLDKLDRNMTKEQAMEPKTEDKTILSTRRSVFDKDEFDVFSRGNKVNLSKVHKGKKRDRTNFVSLLADKSHMTEPVKERLSRYDVYGRFDGFDEYDDEYDDTYDSHEVGAQDDDSADELTLRRPFTIPRVLGGPPAESGESESEEDDEDKTSPGKTTNEQNVSKGQGDDRRQEQGRNQGWSAQRGGGKGRGRGRQDNRGPTGNNREQKGNKGGPKGPPDAKTLRSRANKEKNKGQRANHNRKAGADRKRNQGMGALPPQ